MSDSRKWYQFWKRESDVFEENSIDMVPEEPVHEFNTDIGTAYIKMLQASGEMPYSIKEIRSFTKNPLSHITEIRRMAHWAYHTNGVVASAIDYMKSMHTLDGVVVCKARKFDGSRPKNYRMNKSKMEATLNTIRYKQIIRDGIFKDANDGMYVAYFETVYSTPDMRTVLTDYDIQNITEINAIGMNATVIPLPVGYVKIVGRRNNSYQIAFDLRYFDNYPDDEARKQKLAGFPREIQEGWIKYSNSDTSAPWLILNNDKTIVTKIKSDISDPYGIPFAIAALDDISYAQYFVDTKRNVLDSVNNQIVYETFPEGKEKGTSALTEKQQRQQHDMVKNALASKSRNSSGTSFFSLASGTKLDSISLDVSLLDEKNENSIVDSVNKDIGVAASALDGSSAGNYSSATLNLELVSANVYTWIEDIVDELNKCINKNIINDPSCRVEFYVLPITMVNRDKIVDYMSALYARGKGSLYAWIASTGFNPDNYIALMEYELQEDFENRYPVHRTSFTITGKDDPEHEDHNQGKGGRPPTDSNNPSSIQQKTNGGNNMPKPSSG